MLKLIFVCVALTGMATVAEAQEGGNLPPNTINCSQFKKVGNAWTEVGTATFDLGSTKQTHLSSSPIQPHEFSFGGYDLYNVLEMKCGGK